MVEDERVEEETSETVLISPQKLEASLRYGDPFKFELTFKSPSHYPIDMYYLMDLSQSMEVSFLDNKSNLTAKNRQPIASSFTGELLRKNCEIWLKIDEIWPNSSNQKSDNLFRHLFQDK